MNPLPRTAEQFSYFVTWRQLPLARKASRPALLETLGLPVTRVNRNRANRWRKKYRWDFREADRLAAEAARTDEALAKRRRDIQTMALGVAARFVARIARTPVDKLTPTEVQWLAHYESRIRRDDAIVPSVSRSNDAVRAARAFMGLDG